MPTHAVSCSVSICFSVTGRDCFQKTLATSLPLTMGSGKKAGSAFLLQSPSLDLRGDVAIIGRGKGSAYCSTSATFLNLRRRQYMLTLRTRIQCRWTSKGLSTRGKHARARRSLLLKSVGPATHQSQRLYLVFACFDSHDLISLEQITHLADSFIEVHAEKDTMVESVIEVWCTHA